MTGANGNLGRKLAAALLASEDCEAVVGIDRAFEAPATLPLEQVAADLTQRWDRRWIEALRDVDAIVHLAAQNPFPDATWADAAASFDMTANAAEAAAAGRVRRFVFASSNHVMGGYKDADPVMNPGSLTTSLPPLVGTRTQGAHGPIDSTPYATAKLMGERLLAAKATAEGLTAVSLRIGWCQPGVNDPSTISAAGTPKAGEGAQDPNQSRDRRWFRAMWLSNRDFVGFVGAALRSDAAAWPSPAIVVNAMSQNHDMPWDLTGTSKAIGYSPKDGIAAL